MKKEERIKMVLDSTCLNEMIKCVKNASPNEACGLVFGDIVKKIVQKNHQIHYLGKKFHCFESDKKSPVSFLINNFEELHRVFLKASEEHEFRLVSIFHSHPSGARPSGVDLNNMKFLDDSVNQAFKNQIWTIMDATNQELNAFIYFNQELLEVDVIVKGEVA